MERAYIENVTAQPQIPCVIVTKLLETIRPVHEFVKVDMYLPGCPPSAATFYTVLTELLEGRTPDVAKLTRFGA